MPDDVPPRVLTVYPAGKSLHLRRVRIWQNAAVRRDRLGQGEDVVQRRTQDSSLRDAEWNFLTARERSIDSNLEAVRLQEGVEQLQNVNRVPGQLHLGERVLDVAR
uniref:(northern house mosquito) hypothetical protein n=1 Tax=Culex pipiens TaxID=7175 RepID=A0A8D8I5A5_CULPI